MNEQQRLPILGNFTLISTTPTNNKHSSYTQPLYVETATQLGLMSDPTIPSLVQCLVHQSAPAYTRRFLRRWLLTNPPSTVTDAMAELVYNLKKDGMALPPLVVPPVGKVLSLVRAGQASAQVSFTRYDYE